MFSEGSKENIGKKKVKKIFQLKGKSGSNFFQLNFKMLRKYQGLSSSLKFKKFKKFKFRNLKVLGTNLLIIGLWQKQSRGGVL